MTTQPLPNLILLSSGTTSAENIETARRLRQGLKLAGTVLVIIFAVAALLVFTKLA